MPCLFKMPVSPKDTVVKKEETKKENKFEWADEGVSTLVRVIILGWSAAILTLNYVSIPGIPQKNIDPTFMFKRPSGLFLLRRKKKNQRYKLNKKINEVESN